MTKTNTDFELFQAEFKKWQKRFGLTGYNIYFSYEPLGTAFASIKVSQGDMAATVRLNSKLLNENKPFKGIKLTAKHEALHLLLGRLEQNGRYRYASEEEIYESAEELVHRLEGLIPDEKEG